MRKATKLTAALVLIFSMLILPVSALDVDFDRVGSITATMVYEGEPVPGGTLTIYRVADIAPNGQSVFSYEEGYAQCGIPLDDLDADTASELAAYTQKQSMNGHTKRIDENGIVQFENLELGLYLLIQQEAPNGYYEVLPFLVAIPGQSDGAYIYDIHSEPKQNPEPESSVPTETTEPTGPTDSSESTVPSETTEPSAPSYPEKPSEPELPQTGQTDWPVPILAVTGFFLLCSGVVLMSKDVKQ